MVWTTYASVLLVTGQTSRVEQTLQAAEAALQDAELADKSDDQACAEEQRIRIRDLYGRIAAIRATSAANENQVATIITQSRRALAYLHPTILLSVPPRLGSWDMPTICKEIVPLPAKLIAKSSLSAKRLGIFGLLPHLFRLPQLPSPLSSHSANAS